MSKNSTEIEEGLHEYEDEKKEKKEKEDKKNRDRLIPSITGDYVGKKLSENIDFFDKKENLDINNNYQNIEKFLNTDSKFEDFLNDFRNFSDKDKKDLLEKVKLEVAKQRIGIDKNLATAKKIINEEYKIKDKTKLDEGLKKVYSEKNGKQKIKDILKKKSSRYAFVGEYLVDGDKKFYEEKENNNENNKDFFEDIKGLDANKLTEQQLETLKKIYTGTMILETKDMISFLGMLDKQNRNAILKHFNPSFSLKDLIDNNVITEKRAKDILKKTLQNKANKKLVDKYYNKLNYQDIFFNLDDLKEGEVIKFLETEEAVKPLVEELNTARRQFEKNNTERFYNDDFLKINEDGKIHDNFKKFIKDDIEEIGNDVRATIDDFKKGAYIKVKVNGKDTYYYIEDIDIGGTKAGKHILIKNLTPNIGKDGVRNKDKVQEEMMTYEDLYLLFKSSNKNDKASVEFLSAKDFKGLNLKESGELDNIETEEQLKKALSEKGYINKDAINEPLTNLKFIDTDPKTKEKFIRSFKSANDSKHSLVFNHSNQEMKYSDFFFEIDRQNKKGNKLILEKKINDINTGLKSLPDNNKLGDSRNIIFHKGKLIYEDQKNNEDVKGITTFATDDRKTITIKKISDNGIEFEVGTHKREKEEKDEKGNKIKKYEINNKYKYEGVDSIDDFILILSQGKYSPLGYNEPDTKIEEDGTKSQFKEKGSFMGAWFSMSSMAELIQGGEVMTSAIKEYFERGNDLHAAKWAQLFGGMLPEEVQAKLQYNTTEKRKEVIDKIYKQLDEQNSSDAMNYIQEKILENKHATKEEVFAAIRFVSEKRGNLYPKGLNAKEGQYIWYKKLGGDTNSAEFKEWKAKQEARARANAGLGKKDPNFLKEEDLLENVILKRLGKDGKALYPRVEKDFNKYINNGQANRFKKGEDETSSMFTITERTDNFLAQLKGREYSRTMGVLSKVLAKNSTFESIYFPGFLLSMSGVTRNFNPHDLTKLMGLSYTTPSTGLMFGLSEEGIQTYQNTIIDFYKRKGNYKKANLLKDILDDSKVPKGKDGKPDYEKQHIKRIERLTEFWDENVSELMDFLNMKDGEIPLHKDENENYKKYFDTIKGAFDSGEFKFEENDYMTTGKFSNTPLSDVGSEVALKYINTHQNLKHVGLGVHVSNLYLKRLREIKENKNNLNTEEQKKEFKIIYGAYQKRIRSILGSYLGKINLDTDPGEIPTELRKHNLILNYGKNERENYDEFLDLAFEHFINNEIENKNKSKIENIKEEAKTGIDAVLDREHIEEENDTVYKTNPEEKMGGIDFEDI